MLTEHSKKLVAQHKLGFEILRDAGNEVANAYRLRFSLPDDLRETYGSFGLDLPAANGDPSWTLPLPARYIIDRDGKVRYARVNADYTRRPEPEETLEALEAI